MNILIVGCGRVGSELAGALSREGHTVAIVDANESAFDLLPPDYSGYCTVGIPIDLDVLREAGIENCDALAAVSQDDNTNIMVAEIATKFFGIKNVTARIYDPARQEAFSDRTDIHTICPTILTVDKLLDTMLKEEV